MYKVDSTEKELRLKVAQCCRMLEHIGLIDFSGHVSARIPGTDTVLINGWGAERCELTEKDIVKVDLFANLIEGNDKPPSETRIHTSIYRRRPDVLAIAHLHPPVTTGLFIAEKEWLPVIYHGSIFAAGIPVYDDSRHVNSDERSDRLAVTLGNARVAIIRGHGCVVATESIESCFFASVYLEDNAHKLNQAYLLGKPKALPKAELEEGYKSIWKANQFDKVWRYYYLKSKINF